MRENLVRRLRERQPPPVRLILLGLLTWLALGVLA